MNAYPKAATTLLALVAALSGCSVTAGNPKVPGEKAQIAKRYPAGGTTGTVVELTGRNFGTKPGRIEVGGKLIAPQSWEDGHIAFVTPQTNDSTCSAIKVVTEEGDVSNQMPYTLGDRDVWVPLTDVPSPRLGHVAVWTGSEMIVWGGGSNTGGRYNPLTDSWVPISITGAPAAGIEGAYTAVWTGKYMIVWGNGGGEQGTRSQRATGGRYDPMEDRWYPINPIGAPATGTGHSAVWTGKHMIVWGGDGASGGGRYNPDTDEWAPIATTERATFSPRKHHTAVWTGDRMIIWGGVSYLGLVENTGAVYNPTNDTWAILPTENAPPAREKHAAVWTGTRMLVWGGMSETGMLRSGGSYSPASKKWFPISAEGAPSGRIHFAASWMGARFVVWGGATDDFRGRDFNDGAAYDPKTDSWAPLAARHAPSARRKHSVVSTGETLLVWGGGDTWLKGGSKFNDGSALDLGTNTWLPISFVPNQPLGRVDSVVVWTGSEAIVWGGSTVQESLSQLMHDGARYDPVRNTWLPISGSNAPENRLGARGVWTGNELVVWNGSAGSHYDPSADTWKPIENSPHRSNWRGSSIVWTGKEMILWGGYDSSSYSVGVSDGTRYNPLLGAWAPMSQVGAPAGRGDHAATWTGTEMLIFGGGQWPMAEGFDDGGRYDPTNDAWGAIPPSPLKPVTLPKAAWTGDEMLVVGRDKTKLQIGAYKPGGAWREIAPPENFVPEPSLTTAWTGKELFVYGGTPLGLQFSSLRGAIIDPNANAARIVGDACGVHDYPFGLDVVVAWQSISNAVWTGDRVFIWGPFGGALFYP